MGALATSGADILKPKLKHTRSFPSKGPMRMNNKTYMKQNAAHGALSCPVCTVPLAVEFGDETDPFAAQVGQLTICDCCQSILEYTSNGHRLAIRTAPQRRIEAFDCLTASQDEVSGADIRHYARLCSE